jgi:short-subunit dehydrogenase
VEVAKLDVTSYSEIYPTFKNLSSKLGKISHVIANSGVAGSKEVGSDDFLHDKKVIETNLIAGMATVEASVKIFREQNFSGHILGVSSIAGSRGFPKNASYTASKAGFTNYLEAARIDLQKENILVSTILPGFIDTDMNSHMEKRPFLISPKKGAKLIVNAMEKKKQIAIIPNFPWSILTYLMKRIPDFIWQRIPFE